MQPLQLHVLRGAESAQWSWAPSAPWGAAAAWSLVLARWVLLRCLPWGRGLGQGSGAAPGSLVNGLSLICKSLEEPAS